jgi:hypothetical protein
LSLGIAQSFGASAALRPRVRELGAAAIGIRAATIAGIVPDALGELDATIKGAAVGPSICSVSAQFEGLDSSLTTQNRYPRGLIDRLIFRRSNLYIVTEENFKSVDGSRDAFDDRKDEGGLIPNCHIPVRLTAIRDRVTDPTFPAW